MLTLNKTAMILAQAERIAAQVVDRPWEEICAYHHAADLLMCRAGLRRTMRCRKDYEPNPVEREVEAQIGWDRAKEGIN